MEYRKSIIILILAIFLFSIASVCASDANDTQVDSEMDTVIGLTDEKLETSADESQVIKENKIIDEADDGTFTTLRQKINSAAEHDTIILENNYTCDDGFQWSMIEIPKNITIDGKGHTIDAKGKVRIFEVSNGAIIKNIIFKNGYSSDYGGAVDGYNHKSINCTFINNHADQEGGAISGGEAYNCVFIDNNAEYGGAMHDVKAYGCNFTNNYAQNGGDGGAMYLGTAVNCIFDSNHAEWGGAIMDVHVDNCVFIYNSAYNGGAIYSQADRGVANCVFINNSAYNGGAIYWQADGGVVSNCTFINNSATYECGGAISWQADGGVVSNCTFTNNSASNGGSICWQADNGVVSNCTFTNNSATGGGAIYWQASKGTVSNCTFTNNSAKTYGGAVYWYKSANGKILNCNFTNNDAQSNNGGAVFWFNSNNGNISYCNFVNNSAAAGGAITWSGSDAYLYNSNFTDNAAKKANGGAIYFNANNKANIIGCIFANNSAKAGGAITSSASWEYIRNSTFINNTAKQSNGGAVYATGKDGKILDCNFANNKAMSGGAISLTGNNTLISNSNFTNNSASKIGGGAIYLSSSNSSRVQECIFKDNVASQQGGAIVWSGDEGVVNRSTFINNSANKYGGAIAWYNSKLGSVLNCYFANNFANNGSAYYNNHYEISNSTVNNNVFLNNRGDVDINFTIPEGSNADYNWFGSNADNYLNHPTSKALISIWLFLNATASNDTIKLFNSSNITFKLYAYNSTSGNISEYDNNVLKYMNLTVTPTNGDVDKSTVKLGEVIKYTATGGETGSVTAAIENAGYTLNLKNIRLNSYLSAEPQQITTTYNVNKEFVITLKDDGGNPLTGVNITVDLGGVKTYTTDENGQVKVSTGTLTPKAYTAKITFNGNANYEGSTKDVEVTVNKAPSKITAKKKTFRAKTKVKKYTITLKDNRGKPIKKAKVRISLKKITGKKSKKKKAKVKSKKKRKKPNTTTTNAKGRATFKIDRTKKGKFMATIKYKGNRYYNPVTKKTKITIM